LIPTLMKKALLVTTPTKNYSQGQDLWTKGKRDYLIVGSYSYFGVIGPKDIWTAYPQGYLEAKTFDQQPSKNRIPNSILKHIFNQQGKFYA